MTSNRAEQVETMEIEEGRVELRAVTGPDYGRIYDHELVEAVQRIAGNGTGDTRWKEPGMLGVCRMIYNDSLRGSSIRGTRRQMRLLERIPHFESAGLKLSPRPACAAA